MHVYDSIVSMAKTTIFILIAILPNNFQIQQSMVDYLMVRGHLRLVEVICNKDVHNCKEM